MGGLTWAKMLSLPRPKVWSAKMLWNRGSWGDDGDGSWGSHDLMIDPLTRPGPLGDAMWCPGPFTLVLQPRGSKWRRGSPLTLSKRWLAGGLNGSSVFRLVAARMTYLRTWLWVFWVKEIDCLFHFLDMNSKYRYEQQQVWTPKEVH